MASKKPTGPRYQVYQLKISLQEIEPLIWRRLFVRGDTKFPYLSRIFETVMGWEGYHLHSFKILGSEYGVPDPNYPELKIVDEKNRRLGHVSAKAGASFVFEYDFGDCWRHDVVIEEITEPGQVENYAVCLQGERACPPEDCGGTGGYQEFLEAYLNPTHEEHQQMRDWARDDFDPEAFDLKAVNAALKKVKRTTA